MRIPRGVAAVVAGLLAVARAAAVTVDVSDVGTEVRLVTPELTVHVTKSPFSITTERLGGTTLASAPGSLVYLRGTSTFSVDSVTSFVAGGNGATFTCATSEGPSAFVTVAFLDDGILLVELAPPSPGTVTTVGESFVAPPGERYYGLTERIVGSEGLLGSTSEVAPKEVGSLDRRGELVRMSVAGTRSIYTPFYHASSGFGVFVDGLMQGTFDLAKTDPGRVVLRFDQDPATGVFRYCVILGPGYAKIVERYTSLTGRPWLPPRWVYTHMRWRDEHEAGKTATLDGVAMNADLVEDVTMYEKLGFPAPGWYNFDRPFSSGAQGGCSSPGFARFDFDPDRFPNAHEMIAALARRGTRSIVFNAPWLCGDPNDPADNAYDATRLGYYAPHSPDHIDFTLPAATAWWQDRFGAFLTAYGLSGFKLDRGDETVPSAATDVYADGRNGLQLHNDYPRLYVKAYAERLQALRPNDWVTMTRPGYAGSQSYGLYWAGDVTGADGFGVGPGTDKGLRSSFISLLHLAFMAFPNWGTDIGGYYQFKQRDVFARWLEFGAFNPLMEIGGGKQIGQKLGGEHAPWAMPTTPKVDFEMIGIYRYYTWLHHELVPYSYSEGVRASTDGHPIATPLVFDHPDDPNVADMWDEFFYGPWLLAAPLWRDGDRSRSVYLPAGDWTDYWNEGTTFTGPTTLPAVAAPLARAPLYVKLGAVIPLEVVNGATGHGDDSSAGRTTLDLYPHHASSYDLRTADATVTITSTKAGAYGDVAPITIGVAPGGGSYLLRVKTNFRPASVTVDGAALAEATSDDLFHAATTGWHHRPADGRTLVKLPPGATAIVLTPGDASTCGNRRLDAGEECDDGNHILPTGCTSDCRLDPRGPQFFLTPVRTGKRVTETSVTLTDRFEKRQALVGKPSAVAIPADVDGSGIVDPTAYLGCHALRDAPRQGRRFGHGIGIRERFGTGRVGLIKPVAFCEPAQQVGTPSALDLDRYKCYRSHGILGGRRPPRVAAGRIGPLEMVCVPIQDGEPPRNPDMLLACHRYPGSRARQVLTLENATGTSTWSTTRAKPLVCVPARVQ
jgi:alpha-D-xyloside xylohydrolase